MSQAGVPLETAHGYSPPSVRQFAVFLDNRVGKLLELVEAFSDERTCQLCSLNVHEASDHAVVRLLSNSAFAAREILKRAGYTFTEKDLLVVELTVGNTLAGLCRHLLSAELNIQFAYPIMVKPGGSPTIAISVDDLYLAGQVLRRKGFRLLGECDLPKPGMYETHE